MHNNIRRGTLSPLALTAAVNRRVKPDVSCCGSSCFAINACPIGAVSASMRGDDLQTHDFARPHNINILQPAMIEFPTCRGFLLAENSSSQKEYSWWCVVAMLAAG